jgi:hypothetical protein
MGLKPVMGDVALASASRGAGTFTSGPVAPADQAGWATVYVHASAISGSPTLDVSLEQSADGSTSWTAITGSSITQMTAAGNKIACAKVTSNYVRVTSTVGGTATPTVTFEARLDILSA